MGTVSFPLLPGELEVALPLHVDPVVGVAGGRAGRRPGRVRAVGSWPRPAPRRRRSHIAERAWVRTSSLASRPWAEKTAASAGITTRLIPAVRAMSAAKMPSAPPKAIMGTPRGSWPRSTVTVRTALLMFAVTIR